MLRFDWASTQCDWWLDTLPREDKTLENVLGEWSPIHDAQYADPQARIFGLPGILTSISHNDSSVFEADYEKSAQDVYSEIAQYS